jgi:hypothetical protein
MPHSKPADRQRIYRLYYYLCACLGMKQKTDGAPNYKAISAQLSNNQDFRKVVSSLFQDWGIRKENAAQTAKIRGVTTGSIVEILVKLSRSLKDDYQRYQEPYNRILTQEDILTVLYRLIDLTPEERQDLGLPVGDGLTLLQQALLTLQTVGSLENYEMIFRIYKAAVGLEFSDAQPVLQDLDQVDALIQQTVRTALDYLPDRRPQSRNNATYFPGKENTILELTQKAQREIRRLLSRSGNQQSRAMGSKVVDSYIQYYLQPAFVAKLAQTVVVNERLTAQFPIYLKRITIEPSGPLPFADKEWGSLQSDGAYPSLLHPALRRLDQNLAANSINELPGPGDYELASQEAMRVVVDFYVKVPADYQSVVERVFHRLSSRDGRQIDFSLDSTGIGGVLSNVVKVINVALLRDISCLKDYFSIAHDVTSTQEIIRDNVPSPVWAHSLVKLCHKETVGQTIQACDQNGLRSYEEFAFANPIGHGDYCGFDFLSSQAQAALQARLQAIRNTGVIPSNYLQHLCQRTELLVALKDAWSSLRGYPFSSMAMVGMIDREILRRNVGDRPLTKDDPYIYFDACLSITEALLDEGIYRRSRHYLERLEILEELAQQGISVVDHSPNGADASFEVFSGALIVRYLLCRASYCYLYDTRDHDQRYLPPGCAPDINREGLIRRAWTALDQAQQHANIRLQKYVIINEVSQGTFDPHYILLARIAYLRAKLLIFFPRFVQRDESSLPTERFIGQQRTEASLHWGRLYLTEKARLYAAANGDSEIYACYASMQCWIYLMAAYANPENLVLPPLTGVVPSSLDRHQCLVWAKQLRDHALVSYADAGRKYYYQIKEKSGLPNETDEFGLYRIQKIPAIYEARGQAYDQLSRADSGNFLVFDMALLAVNPDDLPKLSPDHPTQTIYLFGTNASYLFFARGMYALCSDVPDEFDEFDGCETPIHWDMKLNHAMRLLNMAWAIAEEGCDLRRNADSDDMSFDITRRLGGDAHPDEYTSQDIDSVRDLYPRRVTEIADLGKVFAAVCMALRLHTTTPTQQQQLLSDIEQILNTLHSAHHLDASLRALLARQWRYNGHLETYLSRAKTIISDYATQAQTQPQLSSRDLAARRSDLLKQLFAVPLT